MSKEEIFVDPLDALIKKHAQAQNPDNTETLTEIPTETSDVTSSPDILPTETHIDSVDVDYGENDLVEEIELSEKEEAVERERKRQEAILLKASEPTDVIPPNEMDPYYQMEAVGFQAEALAVVTTMVNKVVAKHKLFNGGIPTEDGVRSRVMGDLISIYHMSGDVVTPEFEQTILDNWVGADATTQTNDVNDNKPVLNNEEIVDKPETPVININVEKGNPVTINVDESIIAKTATTHELNIVVKEVSEKELKASMIIENSDVDGIITPYDPGICDVPITLPLSAYRCVLRPINWFDSIKLNTPMSNNPSDNERKKWSVIYNHIKNVSIDKFDSFDDFMKKTKYNDKELLLWALLVATSEEQEEILFNCVNNNCRREIKLKYSPRALVRLNEKHIPKHYQKTHDASVGKEAVDHFNEISSIRKKYQLPTTGIIVELNEPTAHDFVNIKLPLIRELYSRYRPDDVELKGMANTDDPTLAEFFYLMSNAMIISAMSVVKDGKEYRFTDWEDIELIVTESLDTVDSGVLLKLVNTVKDNISPVSFALSNVVCPYCHHCEEELPVTDIGSTLLFQVSRRLMNTNINLIEMD